MTRIYRDEIDEADIKNTYCDSRSDDDNNKVIVVNNKRRNNTRYQKTKALCELESWTENNMVDDARKR